MLMSWIRAAVIAGIVLAAGSGEAQVETGNLLQGKQPVASAGVVGASQLTNEVAVAEGEFWLTEHSARLRDSNAFAIYDLGGPRPIRCAFLQGDNNDSYHVEGSINGDKFFPMFVAAGVPGSGMRTRTLKLVATARFVRVQARGGDGAYSVSEMGLYDVCPTPWPSELKRVGGTAVHDVIASMAVWFTAATLLLIFVTLKRRRLWTTLAACLPLSLLLMVRRELVMLYPDFQQVESLNLWAIVIAGAIALRWYLPRRKSQSPASSDS